MKHKAYFELLRQPDGEGAIIDEEESGAFIGEFPPPTRLTGSDVLLFRELLEEHTNRYGKPSQEEKLEIRNRVMRSRALRFRKFIQQAIDRRAFDF